MDINSIGAGFVSQPNPFSSVRDMQNARENAGGFEEHLRRLQGTYSPGGNSSGLSANLPPGVENVELYEACLELETIMMKNLIKGMRSTIQKSGFIDTSFAGEVYEDMLYDEYAKSFTRNANLGFAEMAYRELSGLR